MQLRQPSISSNPLSTYSTHAIHPQTDIIFIDFAKSNDRIHMLSWDDQGPDPIVFDDGYDDDGVHEVLPSPQIHAHVVSMLSITPVWILAQKLMTLM